MQEKKLLEKIVYNIGSDYLLALNNPRNEKNGILVSKTILLYNSDDETLEQSKSLMQEYFANKKESIKIFTEKDKPSENHNYKIDIGYFLKNPAIHY